MKSIYIVLSHSNTIVSKLIKLFTRDKYSHISLSLDNSCEEMYSFGRKYIYFPLIGCFSKENIHKGIFKIHEDCTMAIYELKVEEEKYNKIIDRINCISKGSKGYNILGLFLAKYRIKLHRKKYYCSEFVYDVLSTEGIDILDRNSIMFRPMEILNVSGLNLIYEGKVHSYKGAV